MRYFRKKQDNKLTAMLTVKNEANRYLRLVLDDLSAYVDEIVILDGGSTDGTMEICASYPKVVSLKTSGDFTFNNEANCRYQLYLQTLETRPDWILAIDADEVFEPRFKSTVRKMINQTKYDWYGFRFFHFWNSMTHYRIDKLWAPRFYGIRLFRHIPGAKYFWNDLKLHCGSIPANIRQDFPGIHSDIRIKHFGYAGTREEHARKYARYIAMDPESKFCPRSHYDSILDENPVLEEWHD